MGLGLTDLRPSGRLLVPRSVCHGDDGQVIKRRCLACDLDRRILNSASNLRAGLLLIGEAGA
jgi:hypothetical protein